MYENVTVVTLTSPDAGTAFIPHVLRALASEGISVDMISQTVTMGGSVSFSFTVGDEALPSVLVITNRDMPFGLPLKCEVSAGNTKFSFFGEAMRNMPGVAAEVIGIFENAQTKMITTSEVDISILVEGHYAAQLFDDIEAACGMQINIYN